MVRSVCGRRALYRIVDVLSHTDMTSVICKQVSMCFIFAYTFYKPRSRVLCSYLADTALILYSSRYSCCQLGATNRIDLMLINELMSRDDAAIYMRVSAQTIWRWSKTGLLPTYKIGKNRLRFRKEDLDRLIITPQDSITAKTAQHV